MNVVNAPKAHEPFEALRPLMFSIAYRMLGSAMEAEDVVQEAYLRYHAASPETIRSPKAFLGTVVTRLCLNQLESVRTKRETYVGPWLPEPVLTKSGAITALNASALTPSQQVELHESISLAFLVVLEQLTPAERAVFLLREVFDYEYTEIADILGKNETACRQLFSRAKKHIAANRPRFKPTQEEHCQLLSKFMQAVSAGELEGLMALLSEDVSMWADGGGKVRGAATQPLHGRATVAQFVLASMHFLPSDYRAEMAEVNGQLAAILRVGNKTLFIIAIEVDSGCVREIRVIGNPDKLKRV